MRITDIKTWAVANPPPHEGGTLDVRDLLTSPTQWEQGYVILADAPSPGF